MGARRVFGNLASTSIRIEPSPKWVRAYLGGTALVDSRRVSLVWEFPPYPAYYFPRDDVRMDLLVPSGQRAEHEGRGEAQFFSLAVGDRTVDNAVWCYPTSPVDALRPLMRIDWKAMDHWFEEDEEVFVHPRNPYSRVDIAPSSRHVRVVIDGITVAESTHPRLLFETGLPTRYYLPLTDVRLDLLRSSDRSTACPYKGTASYWSVDTGTRVLEDVVWTYRTPLPESHKIAGMACFYNEVVDLYVDGVLQERPATRMR